MTRRYDNPPHRHTKPPGTQLPLCNKSIVVNMKPPRAFFVAGLLVSLAFRSASAQATFEVATIKPSPPQEPGRVSSGFSVNNTSGRLSYSNVTLRDLISRAFQVARFQIAGPDWVDTARFDMEATFAPGTPMDQVPVMLQAVLGERFRLATHRETRRMAVYTLTVLKGGEGKLKLIPDKDDNNINSNSSRNSWHVSAQVGMKAFAAFLAERVERPVLDQTTLPGSYQLTLDWAPENSVPAGDETPLPSLFTALQEQLGLKLSPTSGPAEVIVIDGADREPSGN
jgi:uncharacterized protein (TIGR03435 family)